MPRPPSPDPPLPPGFLLQGLAGQADLPLQGLTILAVEDSRYACEALRLMCLRAGARLRRAETLAAARDHLRLYQPDVVIIDLGLPDGRGETLIRDLLLSPRRPAAILGTSGNPDGRGLALAAGADGFLDKPLESIASFCNALRDHLPGLQQGGLDDRTLAPDPLALQDDLTRAAAALADPANRRYVTGFLLGVAHHAHDAALVRAASDASTNTSSDLANLRALLDSRLHNPTDAFAEKP
jgi:CheY-like chemotaxis protein